MNRTSLRRSAQSGRSSDETLKHIAVELRRYDEHLRDARRLAAKTRRARCRIVGLLLRKKYGEGLLDLASLRPADARRLLGSQ